MYMKSVLELKNEVKNEIEKSINSKLKTEIMGIQISDTLWPGLLSIVVMFRNNNGKAEGLLKVDGDSCVLLAPLKVEFVKKEDKEKVNA